VRSFTRVLFPRSLSGVRLCSENRGVVVDPLPSPQSSERKAYLIIILSFNHKTLSKHIIKKFPQIPDTSPPELFHYQKGRFSKEPYSTSTLDQQIAIE